MHCTLNKKIKLIYSLFLSAIVINIKLPRCFPKGSTSGPVQLLSLRAAFAKDSVTSIIILHLNKEWIQCSVSVLTKIKLS